MSEKMEEFMNNIVQLLFGCLYIGIIIKVYRYSLDNQQIHYMLDTIDKLKTNQDKLFEIIVKIRNIIRVDNDLTNKQTKELKKIRRELHAINYILDIKQIDSAIECESDNSSSNSNTSTFKNTFPLSLHNQTHITFPNYLVFNESNLKQTKLPNNNHKLVFIGDNVRLISNELAKFLKVEPGTCIEFDDAYEMVFNYIQEKQIVNIGEDSNLCKLFGINENGDYEFTDTILIKILKELLEPHFKQ
jgi:hypothetical protein